MYSHNTRPNLEDGKYVFRVGKSEIENLVEKGQGSVNLTIKKFQMSKTEAENNTIHALLSAYWISGLHSAPEDVTSLSGFKIFMKENYGVKYKRVLKDGREVCFVKSVADYTKEEAADFITAIRSDISQAGADNDPKILEIIEGMESNAELKLNGIWRIKIL
jgi:hypothetical protein